MEKILLNDGNSIPSVGFGVFRIPNDGSTYRAVRTALDAGYRHIDTAAAYFNEAEAGKAVKDSGVPREEVFVTSKLWLLDYGFAAARSGTERSLKKLGLDYIDLYLLHQPYGDVCGAWGSAGGGKRERTCAFDRRQQHDSEHLEQVRAQVCHPARREPGRMHPLLSAAQTARDPRPAECKNRGVGAARPGKQQAVQRARDHAACGKIRQECGADHSPL